VSWRGTGGEGGERKREREENEREIEGHNLQLFYFSLFEFINLL
jgi:hypothetical protein